MIRVSQSYKTGITDMHVCTLEQNFFFLYTLDYFEHTAFSDKNNLSGRTLVEHECPVQFNKSWYSG